MYTMKHKFSDEIHNILCNADCVAIANKLGLEVDEKRSNPKAWRISGEGGLHIFKDGSGFYNFSSGEKGKSAAFVRSQINCSHVQALDWIHENIFGNQFGNQLVNNANNQYQNRLDRARTEQFPAQYQQQNQQQKSAQKAPYTPPISSSPPPVWTQPNSIPKTTKTAEKAVFVLPEFGAVNRAYAYLKNTRGIDGALINSLIKQGKIRQDTQRGNVCFLGFDNDGNPKSCFKRSTNTFEAKAWRGYVTGSNKDYTFRMDGKRDYLMVFEADIDCISQANMSILRGKPIDGLTRLSMGGCDGKALFKYLEDFPEVKTIVFALDNDGAGGSAVCALRDKIEAKYGADKYKISAIVPHNKDWNEDLVQAKNIMSATNCTFEEVEQMWKTHSIPSEFAVKNSENEKEDFESEQTVSSRDDEMSL